MIRFLTFRNRKKPKSSKQKISAFFILTKLPLLLFSISHSSRFPFLLTPIPPLLPIFPFFTPTPPTPPHFFTFLFSNTSHFFPFSTFLCFTSSHFLPRPFFSIPIRPIPPHFPPPLLQLTPLPLISYSAPFFLFFKIKPRAQPKNTSSPKSKTRKSLCPFPMQHFLRRTIIFFPPTKKINAHPASPKTPPFQNFRLFHFPAEFSQFSFPPHPFFPTKTKKG